MGVPNNYSLECGKGDTPRRISFNVVKDPNREMEYVKSKQMVLNFDARGRSNSESAANRELWAKETCYVYPGPIQYFGPSEVCDQTTKTLALEQQK